MYIYIYIYIYIYHGLVYCALHPSQELTNLLDIFIYMYIYIYIATFIEAVFSRLAQYVLQGGGGHYASPRKT